MAGPARSGSSTARGEPLSAQEGFTLRFKNLSANVWYDDGEHGGTAGWYAEYLDEYGKTFGNSEQVWHRSLSVNPLEIVKVRWAVRDTLRKEWEARYPLKVKRKKKR